MKGYRPKPSHGVHISNKCIRNIVECYKSLNYSFDKSKCCFDNDGNNVAVLVVLSNDVLSFRQSRNKRDLFSINRFDEISQKTRSTLLPKTAIVSKQHSTLSKGRYFTMNSFDIFAVYGSIVKCCFDKVERCFDIVAGVDWA